MTLSTLIGPTEDASSGDVSTVSRDIHNMLEVVRELAVVEKDVTYEGIARLVLADPSGKALPAWTPGAHIDLRLPDGMIRQYSLCGDPADADKWTLCVRHDPIGRGGSRYVYDQLVVGNSIEVAGPRNHFELRPASGYAFFAGGIGITPLRPMLEQAEREGIPWTLVYLGRSRSCMAFVDELAERYPSKVTILPEDEGQQPTIASLLGQVPAGTLMYACGPQGMLDGAVATAAELGRSSDLLLERFAPIEPAEPYENSAFEVECTVTGVTVTVPPETSILDAVREVGISVSFSCSEGTCGTCETNVISGDVDHRDSVLTDEEKEESATMMICVSRSNCSKLVLEL